MQITSQSKILKKISMSPRTFLETATYYLLSINFFLDHALHFQQI